MKLIFLGPPGAGKGTQAAGVSAHLKVPHISTGDMLRAAIKNNTPTGERAREYVESGRLVPDAILIDMVRERLAAADCANGYLLDGFPRTVDQAMALDGIAAPDAVVNIDATLLAQAPKVGPYRREMEANMAAALGVEPERINVKATTEEGLGFTGDGSGMAAHAVALLEKNA